MGKNNAQLIKENEELEKKVEELEGLLRSAQTAETEVKDKLIEANRANVMLEAKVKKLEDVVAKASTPAMTKEEEDAQDEAAIEIEAKKAAARARRKPVLEKREKNRAGKLPSQLTPEQMKIEEECNSKLQKLNMIINGEDPGVLA